MADDVIFKENVEKNHPIFGEYLHAIRMAVIHESDANKKKAGILDYLYNKETSHRISESTVGERGFSTFEYKNEGANAQDDTVAQTYEKVIRHIPFGKTFTISREAAADSKWGLTSDMKKIISEFMRSYYGTRHLLGEYSLINGTAENYQFGVKNKIAVDTTVGDGLPLFSGAHTYYNPELTGTQSNYFHKLDTSSAEAFSEHLSELAIKLRGFKDENGDPLAYIADTIVIPGNRGSLERMVKTVVGTERAAGSNKNDINLQFGNWNLVVLPHWIAGTDEVIVMSSEANKNLGGNMFYQREKLSIENEIETKSRNLVYNGYARMGIGFTTWKHILRATASKEQVGTSTEL